MRPLDEQAFVAFVDQRRARLLGLARVLVGHQQDAEDLLQVALERLAGRWRFVREPDAYVRRTMVNLATDRARSRKRTPVELVADVPEHLDRHPHDDAGDPATALTATDWFVSTIRDMPKRQRTVFGLRFMADLAAAEIAKEMKIPLGTVKSDLKRGLDGLRFALAPPSDPTPAESATERTESEAHDDRRQA